MPRVHVIDGRLEEGLLAEVFDNHGLGTLIHANQYEDIRPAKKKDARAIQMLTREAMEAEELVRRTRATIEKNIDDYFIFEIDGNPVACVALHVFPDQRKAELASLYVSPAHENQGIGRKLIQFVEDRARVTGVTELFALSTQAFTYFQSKAGFVEARAGRSAGRAPGAVRTERPELQGARQEAAAQGDRSPVRRPSGPKAAPSACRSRPPGSS